MRRLMSGDQRAKLPLLVVDTTEARLPNNTIISAKSMWRIPLLSVWNSLNGNVPLGYLPWEIVGQAAQIVTNISRSSV